ncbi:chemotaxis protein CheA [Bdellovibrionota bacterium FG-2]
MDDFEKELKVGFLEEASQLITDAEQCFLNLESSQDDPSVLETIFRLAHNLKGSGKAVGFTELSEFTHQLESLLLKLKKKELAIDSDIVSLLLQCNDQLRIMVDGLKADLEAKFDSTQLLTAIGNILNGQGPVASAPAEPQVSPAIVTPSADAFPDEPALAVSGEQGVPPVDPFEGLGAVVQNSITEPAVPIAPVVPIAAQLVDKPAPKAATPTGGAPKAAASSDESIRVSLGKLDQLVNNVGEMVILQTVLNQHKNKVQSALLQKTITQLSKISKNIQDISMSLRMIPLKQTFQKMQRIVRDTSKTLGKNIELHISGEETELDKTVLENLGDPLVHLIRNAVDHGVEDPEERAKAGKDPVGNIFLRAYHQGDHIVIEIKDDGKGLDAKKLTAKAIEKGLLKPGQTLSDQDAYHLIFAPGFSTKAVVTDVSGRGVGMDVVRTNIEKLSGEVQLTTTLGGGTCFKILLPLTLAIIDGMLINSQDERYVIPLAQVYESIRPLDKDVHFVTGVGEVLTLREENIQVYRLPTLLSRKLTPKPPSDTIAIVVRTSEKPFAVLVDDIIGQQQVVIKRLGAELQHIRGFSGGAILGDGRAALILDMGELVSKTKVTPTKPSLVKGVA